MAKLTILLGKNIAPDAYAAVLTERDAAMIQYPEVEAKFMPMRYYPLHPDAYVQQTLERIRSLLIHGRDVKLWTMSEYLVSWIGQEVDSGNIAHGAVEIRLYADDNKSYRRFGFDAEGVICNAGDGCWVYGWFMPSN